MITLTKTDGKIGYKYTCPLCNRENVKVWEKSAGATSNEETAGCGCLLVIIGLTCIGAAFGWWWAIGILGVGCLVMGIAAMLAS